jgi:hypothetical protein
MEESYYYYYYYYYHHHHNHHHHPCYHHYARYLQLHTQTNHVSTVYSVAAVLYLQFALHIMLFPTLNMFCASTSALPAVTVQCTIWLFFAVPKFRAFSLFCSGIVWVILKWFQSPLLIPVSL